MNHSSVIWIMWAPSRHWNKKIKLKKPSPTVPLYKNPGVHSCYRSWLTQTALYWLTQADCWRTVGCMILIYLFLLERFLCHGLIQICKSGDTWESDRKRLSQVSHRAAGERTAGKLFLVFWKLQDGQLEPNVIMSRLEKHKVWQKILWDRMTGSTYRWDRDGEWRFTFGHETQVWCLLLFHLLCTSFTLLKLLWNDETHHFNPAL